MAVVAKFKVTQVNNFEHNSQVFLYPVCPPKEDDRVTSAEDGSFWQATPSGKLEMTVNNAIAAEQFQPGYEFYLT